MLTALTLLTLCGAWIPQTSQTDPSELLERFGKDGLSILNFLGLTNVFYSPLYLVNVLLVFVNLAVCTATRMAPRIRARLQKADFLSGDEIACLPFASCTFVKGAAEHSQLIHDKMRRQGFSVKTSGSKMIFEKGRIGWLAAPATHLGLFVLLAGILISAATGYNGSVDLTVGQTIDFPQAHSEKPRIGSLPHYRLTLDSSSRESYKSGEPKQWYSGLTLLDHGGRKIASGQTCVNSPFSAAGIDFYQSDWRLSSVKLTLDGNPLSIPLKSMGGDSMGVMPLAQDMLLIAVVHERESPVRLYLKLEETPMPRLFAQLNKGQTFQVSPLTIKYDGAAITSGIHYKYDPGLPIVYASFILLMAGAIFVSFPQYRIWADAEQTAEGTYRWTTGCCPTKFSQLLTLQAKTLAAELTKLNCEEVAALEP